MIYIFYKLLSFKHFLQVHNYKNILMNTLNNFGTFSVNVTTWPPPCGSNHNLLDILNMARYHSMENPTTWCIHNIVSGGQWRKTENNYFLIGSSKAK